MNRVYLLLGSNKGNSEALLNEAVLELIDALLPDYLEAESLADAVNTSDILKSAPWGEFDSSEGPVNDFSNMAMANSRYRISSHTQDPIIHSMARPLKN